MYVRSRQKRAAGLQSSALGDRELGLAKAEPQGTSMNTSSNFIPIRNASTRHEERRQPLEFGPGARVAIMVASSIATWGLVAAVAALVWRTVAAV